MPGGRAGGPRCAVPRRGQLRVGLPVSGESDEEHHAVTPAVYVVRDDGGGGRCMEGRADRDYLAEWRDGVCVAWDVGAGGECESGDDGDVCEFVGGDERDGAEWGVGDDDV